MPSRAVLAVVGLSALTSAFSGLVNAQSQYGDQYWHERYHGMAQGIVFPSDCFFVC